MSWVRGALTRGWGLAQTLVGGTDFNGDGLADIAVGFERFDFSNQKIRHTSYVVALAGNGDGSFAGITAVDTQTTIAAIIDLDQDGHSDLAVPGLDLAVGFGDGKGGFQLVDFNEGLSLATAIAAVDVNRDNFPDVIITSNDGTVAVLLNTAQPLPVLTVNLSGNGSGTVTSDLGGIICPGICSALFANGTGLSLTGMASAGSTFTGWSSACSGTGACSLTMDTDQTVTATFILTPEFSISASSAAPNPIHPGQSSSVSVDISAVNGFSSSVSLTCAVQPAPTMAPQCSLSPSSIMPGNQVTLTITTTAPTLALASPSRSPGLFYAMWVPVVGLALVGIGSRWGKKTTPMGFLLCSLLFVEIIFQGACGGNHGSPGTPPDTYAITVTGTSGSLRHSTTVNVTVQ